MTVTVLGDAPKIERQVTGLYTFDRAFQNRKGEIGLPLGTGVEVFGGTSVGKSTSTYGIAGLIAGATNQHIALADFEGFDPEFLVSVLETVKFDGHVQYIRKKDDEETLDELLSCLRKKEFSVGIVDSVGAISPISEAEGDLGAANMGRRALIMAQFTRKSLKLLRDSNKVIFMINHSYPIIGGRGSESPGGEVKKYLASIRIQVRRKYVKGKYEEFPDGSYILEGTIKKNRWGYKDRTFNLFVLAGKGLHLGLTAMYDCVALKKATKDKVIKIGDTSFGRLKEIVDKAQEGDDQFFTPFFDALNSIVYEEPIAVEDTIVEEVIEETEE